MKELNWTLRHRRLVIFGSILYIICSLFACDDKVANPPRPPQENPIPVTSEQKEADNAQEADEITADELDAYREGLKNLSTDELIANARSDASEIKAGAKNLARHLADNKQEEAERISVDLRKKLKKTAVLANVIRFRQLAGESSKEQRSTIKDLISEMTEALDLAMEVQEAWEQLAEEK